jgi:bifunctional polynucleotide phosphatase/kinase
MEDHVIQRKKSRRAKLAIFDLDWTIIKPKDGRTFPLQTDDWQYYRTSVPTMVRNFAKTHQIVIVTDQSKPWKIDMIQDILQDLDIDPITVIVGGKTKKPNTALFLSVFPQIQTEKTFYVGDAAGRPGDWSDRDRIFAERLGIRFFPSDSFFSLEERIFPTIPIPETREVVIMVGYPASGKSTIAKTFPSSYTVIDSDTFKTAKRMIQEAKRYPTQSIVFDSTAGTKAKRAEFLQFAREQNLSTRTIWVQTPIDVAMEQNKERAKALQKEKIPDIAFYTYRKRFEEPTEEEGFTLLKL